MIGAVRASPG